MAAVPVGCWRFLDLSLVEAPLWIMGSVALAPAALGALLLTRMVTIHAMKVGDGFGAASVGFGLSLVAMIGVGALDMTLVCFAGTGEGCGYLLPFVIWCFLSLPVQVLTAALVWWWGNRAFAKERSEPGATP